MTLPEPDRPESADQDSAAAREADAAGREAGEIGGRPSESEPAGDEADRAVREGGGGEAEGFEEAEEELRRAAEREEERDPVGDAGRTERHNPDTVHGEADRVRSTERTEDTGGDEAGR